MVVVTITYLGGTVAFSLPRHPIYRRYRTLSQGSPARARRVGRRRTSIPCLQGGISTPQRATPVGPPAVGGASGWPWVRVSSPWPSPSSHARPPALATRRRSAAPMPAGPWSPGRAARRTAGRRSEDPRPGARAGILRGDRERRADSRARPPPQEGRLSDPPRGAASSESAGRASASRR